MDAPPLLGLGTVPRGGLPQVGSAHVARDAWTRIYAIICVAVYHYFNIDQLVVAKPPAYGSRGERKHTGYIIYGNFFLLFHYKVEIYYFGVKKKPYKSKTCRAFIYFFFLEFFILRELFLRNN